MTTTVKRFQLNACSSSDEDDDGDKDVAQRKQKALLDSSLSFSAGSSLSLTPVAKTRATRATTLVPPSEIPVVVAAVAIAATPFSASVVTKERPSLPVEMIAGASSASSIQVKVHSRAALPETLEEKKGPSVMVAKFRRSASSSSSSSGSDTDVPRRLPVARVSDSLEVELGADVREKKQIVRNVADQKQTVSVQNLPAGAAAAAAAPVTAKKEKHIPTTSTAHPATAAATTPSISFSFGHTRSSYVDSTPPPLQKEDASREVTPAVIVAELQPQQPSQEPLLIRVDKQKHQQEDAEEEMVRHCHETAALNYNRVGTVDGLRVASVPFPVHHRVAASTQVTDSPSSPTASQLFSTDSRIAIVTKKQHAQVANGKRASERIQEGEEEEESGSAELPPPLSCSSRVTLEQRIIIHDDVTVARSVEREGSSGSSRYAEPSPHQPFQLTLSISSRLLRSRSEYGDVTSSWDSHSAHAAPPSVECSESRETPIGFVLRSQRELATEEAALRHAARSSIPRPPQAFNSVQHQQQQHLSTLRAPQPVLRRDNPAFRYIPSKSHQHFFTSVTEAVTLGIANGHGDAFRRSAPVHSTEACSPVVLLHRPPLDAPLTRTSNTNGADHNLVVLMNRRPCAAINNGITNLIESECSADTVDLFRPQKDTSRRGVRR